MKQLSDTYHTRRTQPTPTFLHHTHPTPPDTSTPTPELSRNDRHLHGVKHVPVSNAHEHEFFQIQNVVLYGKVVGVVPERLLDFDRHLHAKQLGDAHDRIKRADCLGREEH